MSIEVTEADGTVWHPPFCANEVEHVKCPKCGEIGGVRVREKEQYYDGEQVEAYCAECHTRLWVVEITFSDAEIDE